VLPTKASDRPGRGTKRYNVDTQQGHILADILRRPQSILRRASFCFRIQSTSHPSDRISDEEISLTLRFYSHFHQHARRMRRRSRQQG
jgi:hypothetical protein